LCNDVDESVRVNGNESLLFSVFQNFMEKHHRYAGKGNRHHPEIHEDEKFCYFSYAENGTGIPEETFAAYFRTFLPDRPRAHRETGGTGWDYRS
jgi:K+-sensing histidine kinase KdpD